MILQIPNVAGEEYLARLVSRLDHAKWTDGKTSDYKSLADLQEELLRSIESNPKFVSAALPVRSFPPTFRRLDAKVQEKPKLHSAIRNLPGSVEKMRVDLVAILMLFRTPGANGGELQLLDSYGQHAFPIHAGTLLLYPASLRRQFSPLSEGHCLYAEIAVQSSIWDGTQRKLLFDMDSAIQALRAANNADETQLDKLAGVYHNLLRYWARQ